MQDLVFLRMINSKHSELSNQLNRLWLYNLNFKGSTFYTSYNGHLIHACIHITYILHTQIHTLSFKHVVAGHSQHSHCKLFTSIVDLQMERVNI